MKKVIILLALLALVLGTFSCGGGGAGSANVPSGENPGLPSVVQLLPTQYIAQTNAIITLHTKLLDGNGIPVPNTPITFTNLSPIGVLSSTGANTDASGIATVTLYSTTPGFSTVQAEVNTGAGNVRDRKSVFFTTAIVIYPSLSASIDGDGDGVFDESDDFVMIANGRDTATLKARLLDATETPLVGRTILFSTDTTFIDCTESKDACIILAQPFHEEVLFPNGRTAWTNSNGEGTIEIVLSSNIKEFRTSFNVAAQDTTSGATDMFTVFLDPVTIGRVTVVANPQVLAPSGTSDVTTCAYTTGSTFNTGVPVPDGTIIQLSATAGIITPFVQTVNGCATTTYTAPSTTGNVIITATAGGVIGTTTVTVTTALTVSPAITVDGVVGGTATFTITGGIPSYTITRNNAAAWTAPVPATVTTSGGTFTVTVPANTPATTVTYTIRDSVGTAVTATLTVGATTAFTVTPASQTIPGGAGCAIGAGPATYNITGGMAPFTASTSHPAFTSFTAPAAGNNITIPVGTTTFTVAYDVIVAPVADTTVTLTIVDATGVIKTVTFLIDCP